MRGTVVGRVGQIYKKECVGANNTFLLSFSVAEEVYLGSKGKHTTWHECAYFGRRAESVANYVEAGNWIAVTGQDYTEEYEGKLKLKVKVDDITLLGGKSQSSAPAAPTGAPGPPKPPSSFDDDVPF